MTWMNHSEPYPHKMCDFVIMSTKKQFFTSNPFAAPCGWSGSLAVQSLVAGDDFGDDEVTGDVQGGAAHVKEALPCPGPLPR